MSDERPVEPGASFEEMPTEQHRRASLVLRAEDVREARAASMAAANKALTDALRITYILLLVVMAAIVGMFLLSGYQQVNQAERGLKVSFGRIVDRDLQPGPHLALPEPIGEIISVPTSQRTVVVERPFLPLNFDTSRPVADQGDTGPTMRPGNDGYLITADRGIVHASISATYSVSDPALYLENLETSQEQAVVKAVVARAVVSAFAARTIDEVLFRATRATPAGEVADAAAPVGNSSIERDIRQRAQDAIDRMDIGLTIDQVALRLVFPPSRVREEFLRVNEVDAAASRALQEAEEARRRRLNEVAGSAALPLLDLIGDYEAALDAGDQAAADAHLQTIFRIFDGDLTGRDIEINGRTYPEVALAGEASQAISLARRARTSLVDAARQRALTFEAKLAQYRANPRVFVIREWTEALAATLARPHVQAFLVSSRADFEIMLNNDPEIARALQAAIQRRLTEETMRERERRVPGSFR